MSTIFAVVIAVAIAVVGVAVGYLLRTTTMPRTSAQHTAPAAPVAAAPVAAAPVAAAPAPAQPARAGGDERLIHALIGVYDTSGEESVRSYVVGQLGALGIVPLTPEPGSLFSAQTQRCVATEAVSGAPAGTLIRTDRPGWRGPAGTLRLPDVTVVAAERI